MDAFAQFKGQMLDNRYKIIEKVGQGGMAVVFAATDVETGQKVAIKMLKETAALDVKMLKRFINESRAISMFDHKNIVKVYDISVDGPFKYIVMEFIDGISLRDYLSFKKPIDWRDACVYCEQVLSALQHAHNKRVIHRDIKPANIMLMEGGYVKVTDFGIAKIVDGKTSTLTANTAIGTVYYISPEQAQNKKIDNKCDIYSVGCMLYEMVTGKLPFVADTPINVIMKQVQEEPVHPSEYNAKIPFGLEQIILCAMQKDPANRYNSANEMLMALRQIRSDPTHLFVVTKKEKPTQVATTPRSEETKASYYINDGQPHAEIRRPQSSSSSSSRPASSNHSGHVATPVMQQRPSAQRQPSAQGHTHPQQKTTKKRKISIPKVILVFLIFFAVTLGLLFLFVSLFSGNSIKTPCVEELNTIVSSTKSVLGSTL